MLIVPLGATEDPITTGVVPAAEDSTTTGDVVGAGGAGGDAVTGHTVVEMAIVTVVTEPYGQLVIVGAHFEIV